MTETYHSIITAFHNQKDRDFQEDSLYGDFNAIYSTTSTENNQEYNPKLIETAFSPIIETIKNSYSSFDSLKILEIGGASGLFSKYLQDLGSQITMIETQPKFVTKAQERGIKAHLYNGSTLPFTASDKFDIVVANRVFEDIVMPEYLATSLIKQMLPLLKNNSSVAIGSSNPSAIWNYSFFKNGLQLKSSRFCPWNNYLKEARIYQEF